jgi:hypothetical protein
MLAREAKTAGHPRAPERWLLYLFRFLVFGALAILMLLGVRTLVYSLTSSATSRVAPAPARPSATGAASDGFPTLAAEAFAARFAQAYETYDGGNPAARQQALLGYLPPTSDPGLGWDGQGRQTASAALPSGIEVRDRQRALVTVAVEVTPFARDGRAQAARWIYLAVPVVAEQGALAVAGRPAEVPAPARAAWAPPSPPPADDAALEAYLRQTLPDFFRAYASDSPQALAQYAAPGATLRGLGGQVAFGDLLSVRAPLGAADRRTAVVSVRWSQPANGAGLAQDYQVQLIRVAGQWRVSDVEPALD